MAHTCATDTLKTDGPNVTDRYRYLVNTNGRLCYILL